MTKKIAVMALVICMLASGVYAFNVLSWWDGGEWSANNYTLSDSGDNDIMQSGLLFQVVVDRDGDTDFASMLNGYWYVGAEDGGGGAAYGSDDDYTTTGNGWTGQWLETGTYQGLFGPSTAVANSAPLFATVPDTATTLISTLTNENAYIRWFNASSIGGATEGGIIYNLNWTTHPGTGLATSGDELNINYITGDSGIAGSDDTGNTGWATMAAIPEPSTMLLMSVGAAAMLGRRRRKK